MTTNFPSSIDVLPNPSDTTHLDEPGYLHADQHANVNDAVVALENKMGVNFSNVANTIDYIASLFLLVSTQHYNGGYREITYSGLVRILPVKISWYTNSGKTVKLVEKELTYGSGVKVLPTQIILRLFDGTTSNVVKRTITDNITYDKLLETSRTRTVG